jgi:hypothetical protein
MSIMSQTGLYDVIDVILDKGLVIDAFVRVSIVGIEVLTVDARVVVASVDTYLHFAEAANRLDLRAGSGSQPLGALLGGGTTALGSPSQDTGIGGGVHKIRERAE